MKLQTLTSFLCYILRQNMWVWKNLDDGQRKAIKDQNFKFNSFRPTYNPDDYKDGQNFNSEKDRMKFVEGRMLKEFLEKRQPKDVLEIGPGSGFFSRTVLEAASLEKYTALELNQFFGEYLDKSISDRQGSVPHTVLIGDYDQVREFPFDTIVALSSIHHIPDREQMLMDFARLSKGDFVLFAFDATHYIPRVVRLLKKVPKYIRSRSYADIGSWSTHHFVSIREYQAICDKIGAKILSATPVVGPRAMKLIGLLTKFGFSEERLKQIFSTSIGVEILIPANNQ